MQLSKPVREAIEERVKGSPDVCSTCEFRELYDQEETERTTSRDKNRAKSIEVHRNHIGGIEEVQYKCSKHVKPRSSGYYEHVFVEDITEHSEVLQFIQHHTEEEDTPRVA